MIDNAKSEYIKSELNRNSKNAKKFWRIINSFLVDKRSSLADITFSYDDTGNPVPKGSEANNLNEYFVNIATRLGMHPNVHIDEALFGHYDVHETLCFEDFEISILEVERLAKEIDISKASCIESINSHICRDVYT